VCIYVCLWQPHSSDNIMISHVKQSCTIDFFVLVITDVVNYLCEVRLDGVLCCICPGSLSSCSHSHCMTPWTCICDVLIETYKNKRSLLPMTLDCERCFTCVLNVIQNLQNTFIIFPLCALELLFRRQEGLPVKTCTFCPQRLCFRSSVERNI